MVLEVDVEPLAASQRRLPGSLQDEGGSHAPSPLVMSNHGVKDKGVGPSVPSDVDEANEAVLLSGANPTEAVLVELRNPVTLGRLVVEAIGMERFQLDVGEGTVPFAKCGHLAPE